LIKVAEQTKLNNYLILTLTQETPNTSWHQVFVGGKLYNLVPAFDIGLNRLVVEDDGTVLVNSEIEFV